MIIDKDSRGRPPLTKEQITLKKTELLQRIKPYLMSGLSINKSIHEAKIANSELYKYMSEDEGFREQITRFKQYIYILLNNSFLRELLTIVEKQNGNENIGIEPQMLSREDVRFLMWFALHGKHCKEEFGRCRKMKVYDPEAELQKISRVIN